MDKNNKSMQSSSEGPSKPNVSEEVIRAKNQNPRANENLDKEDKQLGDTDDVGSEITDGEDA